MPTEAPAAPPPPTTPAPPTPAPAAAGKLPNPVLDNPAIEDHFKSYDKPAAPKPEAKAPEPKKDAPKPAEKAPETPKTEPKAEAKTEPKSEPAPEAEHKNIKELRTAYETTKKAAQAHEAKIKELEARIAEGAKTQAAPDEKVWQERVSAKEKELAEYRAKLAEQDFTQSAEYQDKYWKPYVNSFNRGMNAIMGLKAQNEDGTTRDVTQQDAEFLLSLPDAKALQVGRQMFGDDITALTILTHHKSRIAESAESLKDGKAQFQKIAEETRNKKFTETQAMEEARGRLWAKENEAFVESSPYFKPDENDPEASEALNQGYADIDRIFSDEFNKGKMEDIVKAHVKMRHQAAAFPRMEHTIKKLTAELEAIRKERDELMDSAPKGDGSTPKTPVDEADMLPSAILDKIQWKGR